MSSRKKKCTHPSIDIRNWLNLGVYYKCLLLPLALSLFVLSGCSTVYKGTGDVLISYAGDEAIPYLLRTEDIDMVCGLSESLAPFIFSFEEVTHSPDQLKIVLHMISGHCAQKKASEAQLQYLQAVKRGNSLEAKDARILQKRYLNLAASRYFLGYKSLIAAYGEPGEACPKLNEHSDQMYWLAGLLNGLQSLFSDMGSEAAAGIPTDIAVKVARSAECLNDERWWGAPRAIQGAVWAMLPGSGPKGVDPYKMLSEASEVGERRRVRLAHVLAAEVYLSKGQTDKVKEIIRVNAQQVQEKPADPAYNLLDRLAYNQLVIISDQLWSQAVGHRTPWLGYGTFWDDEDEDVLDLDIGDLL